jgi:hypothetical protein
MVIWQIGCRTEALRRTILFEAGSIHDIPRARRAPAAGKMQPPGRQHAGGLGKDIAGQRRFDRSTLPKSRLSGMRFFARPRIADMR